VRPKRYGPTICCGAATELESRPAGDRCCLLDKGLLKVMVTSSRGEERTIASGRAPSLANCP
jgi:hypothetical protein